MSFTTKTVLLTIPQRAPYTEPLRIKHIRAPFLYAYGNNAYKYSKLTAKTFEKHAYK